MERDPANSYEAPSVEQVDTEDSPAVTAAGEVTDSDTTTTTIN
jgi:hypothetical protein